MIRYSALVLFIFSISQSCLSQDNDSIRAIVKKRKHVADTAYILALTELAYQLYSTQPDSSLLYATLARELATKIEYNKGIGRAIRVEGIFFWTKGDYKMAFDFFSRALAYSEKSKDSRGIANCETALGAIYRSQGNYEGAIQYFFSSLKVRQSLNDKQGIATTNNNIGVVYQDMREYEKALQYFSDALQMQVEIKDKSGMGRSYLNVGIASQHLNRFDNAVNSYKLSLRIVEEIGDQRGITLAVNHLANVYILNNQLPDAELCLKRGLEIATRLKFKDRIADLKEAYANYFIAGGKPQLALEYARESITIAKEVGNLNILMSALERYSIAAYKLGKFKESIDTYKEYIHLKDSIATDKIKRSSLASEYSFKEDKIKDELEKKKLENLAAEERHKRIVNTFGGITATIIIISVFILISRRKIKMQKEELERHKKELADSNEEISSQRDLLASQNALLENARGVIERNNETLKEEVAQRTQELLEYNHQLEKFAFMSAHNLRAPVARVLGLCNLLNISREQPEEERAIIVDKLKLSAYEMDEVVKDLNFILQLRRDVTSTITFVNIKEEFNTIKSILSNDLEQSGGVIIEELSKTETIKTVKSYFQNILLSLLSNSIKYRDPTRQLIIKVVSEATPEYYVFSVTDNGLGLDLSLHGNKLFNFYSRFHFHVDGKGLALYVVKTQLSVLDGKIEVRSQVGVGSTFKVSFKRI